MQSSSSDPVAVRDALAAELWQRISTIGQTIVFAGKAHPPGKLRWPTEPMIGLYGTVHEVPPYRFQVETHQAISVAVTWLQEQFDSGACPELKPLSAGVVTCGGIASFPFNTHALVHGLVVASIDNDSRDMSKARFEQALAGLRQIAGSGVMSLQLILPLSGLRTSTDSVQLDPGGCCTLLRLSDPDRLRLTHRTLDAIVSPRDVPVIGAATHVLQLTFRVPVEIGGSQSGFSALARLGSTDAEASRDRCAAVVAALALHGHLGVDADDAFQVTLDPSAINLGITRVAIRRRGESWGVPEQPTLVPEDAGAIWRTSEWVLRVSESEAGAFAVALHRVHQARAQSDWAERLIDAVIALDALILPGVHHRTGWRFRHVGLPLLQRAGRREVTTELLKEIYDCRSDLVHGERLSVAQRQRVRVLAGAALDFAVQLLQFFQSSGVMRTEEHRRLVREVHRGVIESRKQPEVTQ